MLSETLDPSDSEQIQVPAPKTALVLSSGGLFGAYQAGVWSYLAEANFRPDYIVGASVGALNGWAIAGNCGGSALSEMWRDESRSNVLLRVAKPGLLKGLFHHEPLRKLVARIFADYGPSSKFGLVTVELPSLRSHLFRGAAITPDHLLASASIPLAMPAVSIGGKRFTDGGLLEDVPLWGAVEMGATRIVAVDAMHFDCPWWYRAGVKPIGLFAPRIRSAIRAGVTLIRPDKPLGHYQEALTWNRNRIERWMERGYEDARRTFIRRGLSGSLASA